MKTVFGIFKRDLIALLKNPIALLVVGALLVLPGLYAWYCIVANWDPYSNTGNVPIAVVNRDAGAESDLTGPVDVGAQVIDKLESNDSIDWRFYDVEEEALADTRLGTCYAAIVLPEDLSRNLVGIFEGSKEHPTLYYYPNEKYNAVATKVGDSAAQTLVRQINQSFSSTVNETILESVQGAADRIERKADQTNRSAIEQVAGIQADIDRVIVSLDDALDSIGGWRSSAAGADAALSATAGQLPHIRALLDSSADQLDSLRVETGDFEDDLFATILESSATVSNLSAQTSSTLAQATEDLRVIGERLEVLGAAASDDLLLKVIVDALDVAMSAIEGTVSDVNARVDKLDDKVQATVESVSSATGQISGEVMPQLSSGTYELSKALSELSGAVGQFEPQIVQLRAVLSQTDGALGTAVDAIADAKALLSTIGADLEGTVADIGAIGNALQVKEITELLDVDPESVGTFVSSPVQMVTEKVYPVSNYGTAVAPFYTNLALWIGCFILVSLIKVEVDPAGFERATSRQRYFGRWLLFVLLAVLQSQVICGVDILLGIDCAQPGYFMMAGAVCSFVYMNIIFALVTTFRNIGKTLCIFLLIMQVPGSSGMYPIQMMPAFFQAIHPALPFTYGIDAMREALCGMYGMAFLKDVSVLLLIVPAALLLGLGIRPLLSNLTLLFDREMSATGFFASEVHAQAESDLLRRLMRALGSHDSMRDEFEERTWRFSRRYPRLRRVGSIALFAIPLLLLFIVLPFNLASDVGIDVKIGALMAAIVLLFVVQVALIVLEYMHRMIADQSRLVGLEILSESGLMDDADDPLSLVGQVLDEGDAGAPTDAPARKLGPAWDIFATDMRLGFQSVIGVVVIMLLVITPSLYAWFNIAGSWDPYSSTKNLKVAVANEDQGFKGDLVPLTINIGDTVVSQLRGNSSFDWVFVDRDEAVSGVESSEYYAAIEIPDDFSEDMMTYLTGDADYPDVRYYTNEKDNPIAPIITQKGADSIQENIRVSFTERVDQVVLTVAYDVLDYVARPEMSDYAAKMSGHLDEAVADAEGVSRELRALSSLAGTVSSVVEATGTTLDGVRAAGAAAGVAVSDAKAGAADAADAMESAVSIVEDMLDDRQVDVERIESVLDTAFGFIEDGSAVIPGLIEVVIAQVEDLRDGNPDVPAARFDSVIDSLKAAKRNAAAVPGKVSDGRAETKALIREAKSELDDARAFFDDTAKPSFGELRSTTAEVASSTSAVVDGLEATLDGMGDSTGGLSRQLTALSGDLAEAGDKVEGAAEDIGEMRSRVADALRSGDLRQVEMVILGGDPEAMAASLAAPVQSQRDPIYPVSNYGSAMAPFYTVLSLWVGALVMISTMRTRLVESRIDELRRRYGRVRPRHEFFGRYGVFGFIGLLQSALVLLGDLLLLNIQCADPVMFIALGLFIGQVFCLFVFTLTELFGDIGKALCVILLIMQVAASGGTFPAEMLDPLLHDIVPFLPFYHAMRLLQECVAGIYWPGIGAHVAALGSLVAVTVIAGVPLRKPFHKLDDFFEHQLEKTGYM